MLDDKRFYYKNEVMKTLREVTGEKFKTEKQWKEWWAKNKSS